MLTVFIFIKCLNMQCLPKINVFSCSSIGSMVNSLVNKVKGVMNIGKRSAADLHFPTITALAEDDSEEIECKISLIY